MTPVQFAEKARSLGYDWATLELDDYNNFERWGPFRSACQAVGMKAGPWFTGGDITLTPMDADFTIAEVESEGDRQNAINSAGAVPASMPKAVITNFTPMTDGQGVPQPEKAAPLIAAGYECITECYEGDSPGMEPYAMNHRATVQLGWPRSQPCYGIWNKPFEHYAQYDGYWPARSYYLSEYLI